MNKKTEYRTDLLLGGFAEGCYTPGEDYGNIEGSEIKENNNKEENIEDIIIDAEVLLRNARGA